MHYEKTSLSDGLCRQLVHFTGLTELVETVHAGLERDEQDPKCWQPPEGRPVWAHGETLRTPAASRHCLLYGEPPAHVVAKAEAFQQALLASDTYRQASEKARSTRRRRVFELDGGELDLDRYLGQQDECWSRITRGLQRPLVRLAISGTASEENSEDTFAGTAALATCCALLAEQAGCSLEILGTIIVTDAIPGTREAGCVLPLKHADEALHQATLLSFGIPAVLRYYGFAVDHNLLQGEVVLGHGYAEPMSAVLRAHLGVQHVLEVAWSDREQRMFLDEFVQTLHEA